MPKGLKHPVSNILYFPASRLVIITERSLNVRPTFSLSRDILRSIAREEDAAGAAVDVVDVVYVDVDGDDDGGAPVSCGG